MAVERGRQLRRGRPRGKGYLLEESRGHDGPAKTYKRKTQRDQNRRSKFSHSYREGFPKHFSLQRNRTSPCRQPLFHAARRPTGAALLLRRLFHQHIAQVVAAIIACRTVIPFDLNGVLLSLCETRWPTRHLAGSDPGPDLSVGIGLLSSASRRERTRRECIWMSMRGCSTDWNTAGRWLARASPMRWKLKKGVIPKITRG
jgi:hypothetical protein